MSVFHALVVTQRGGACLYDLNVIPAHNGGQTRFSVSLRGRPNIQPPEPGDRATIYETVVGTKRVLYHGEISLVDADFVNEVCHLVLEHAC